MSEISDITRPVLEVQPLVLLPLMALAFVFFFGLLNILLGMVFENVVATMADINNAEAKAKQVVMAKAANDISEIMKATDTNGDSKLCLREFESDEMHDVIAGLLGKLRLPHGFTLADLFCMLDVDMTGDITETEFLEGAIRLIVNTDFHRDCEHHLALSQIRRQLRTMQDFMGSSFHKLECDLHSELEQLKATLRPLEVCEGMRTYDISAAMKHEIAAEIAISRGEIPEHALRVAAPSVTTQFPNTPEAKPNILEFITQLVVSQQQQKEQFVLRTDVIMQELGNIARLASPQPEARREDWQQTVDQCTGSVNKCMNSGNNCTNSLRSTSKETVTGERSPPQGPGSHGTRSKGALHMDLNELVRNL